LIENIFYQRFTLNIHPEDEYSYFPIVADWMDPPANTMEEMLSRELSVLQEWPLKH
jgi:hypothetical protein